MMVSAAARAATVGAITLVGLAVTTQVIPGPGAVVDAAAGVPVVAAVHDRDGRALGQVTVTDTVDGRWLRLDLARIPAGQHRLHLLADRGCGRMVAASATGAGRWSAAARPALVHVGADGRLRAAVLVDHDRSDRATDGSALILAADPGGRLAEGIAMADRTGEVIGCAALPV